MKPHLHHSSIGRTESRVPGSRTWGTLAVLIAILGIAGSVTVSAGIAHQRLAASVTDNQTDALRIAQTLGLSLQHEDDLVTSAESFALDNPFATQARFAKWAENVNVMAEYPELFGIGSIQVVPRAGLSASRPARKAASVATRLMCGSKPPRRKAA